MESFVKIQPGNFVRKEGGGANQKFLGLRGKSRHWYAIMQF